MATLVQKLITKPIRRLLVAMLSGVFSDPSFISGPRAVYVGRRTLLVRTRFGFPMYVSADDTSVSPWLAMEGQWEPHVTEVVRRTLKRGDVFVDVGANIGWYTLIAAIRLKGTGRIYAVEPNPAAWSLLERSLSMLVSSTLVKVLKLGVSDADGEAELRVWENRWGVSSFVDVDWGEEFPDRVAQKVTVPIRRLDDLIAEPVDLMKIDVEGFEMNVLRGAAGLLRNSPNLKLIVENNPLTMRAARAAGSERQETVHGFLTGLGFKPFLITRDGKLAPITDPSLLERDLVDIFYTRS